MQFSESWLHQFVNPAIDSKALSHAMTMAGLEVEEQRSVAPPFSKVVVAEEQISKSKNTPFVGMDLPGQVRHVFFQGKPTMISTEMVAR